MKTQPVPRVDESDVRRVAARDFPADRQLQVFEILNRYGHKPGYTGKHRVQLDAMKLAAGDVERLEIEIEAACEDYREVIGPAEYPEYIKKGLMIKNVSPEEYSRILESDWRQYEDWLRR